MTLTWSNRPRALLAIGLGWAGISALGSVAAVRLATEAPDLPPEIFAIVLGLAVFLAALGLRRAVLCLGQIRTPSPVLAIGPDGVFDRRLAPQTIPWAEIASVDVVHMLGTRVMLGLAPAGQARIRPLERALARLSGFFLLPGYRIFVHGTEASAEEVAAALRRHFAVARAAAGAGQP
jgi:hypothetical protein